MQRNALININTNLNLQSNLSYQVNMVEWSYLIFPFIYLFIFNLGGWEILHFLPHFIILTAIWILKYYEHINVPVVIIQCYIILHGAMPASTSHSYVADSNMVYKGRFDSRTCDGLIQYCCIDSCYCHRNTSTTEWHGYSMWGTAHVSENLTPRREVWILFLSEAVTVIWAPGEKQMSSLSQANLDKPVSEVFDDETLCSVFIA